MIVEIRQATELDIPELLSLIRELALYEKAPNEVTVTEGSMLTSFREGRYEAMVATCDGNVQGMVLYYEAYSTWKGKYLYLDDFVVRESYRGNGLGAQLFDALLQVADNKEVAFLKWQVLKWNDPAINFYKKYRAHTDDEWLDMKIFFQTAQ